MIGGNITDISQFDGMRLICQYWHSVNSDNHFNVNLINDSLVIVGDVHGDFNQFIAPLVLTGLITITSPEVKEIDNPGGVIYLPEYTINTNNKKRVIYLGDMVDEWIFSRSIVVMLYDILRQLPNNVKYIFGNHDLALIGRYQLYTEKSINFALDTPALWQTLKKELNHVKNLKIYRTTAELDGEPFKGYDYIHSYVQPLFESLWKIFSQHLGVISCVIELNKKPFIVSHTTWSVQAVQQLMTPNNEYSIKSDRPGDNKDEQKQPFETASNTVIEEMKYVKQLIDGVNAGKLKHENLISEYQHLSTAINAIFRTKSKLYISKNLLTYTRITKNIFLNHIIGHSSGAEFRDQGVNVGLSIYYEERESKLSPTFFNQRTVYYFDFGCSAGYDHDEISHPDFVYSNSSGLFVSNLPAFSFIINNGRDALLVLNDKTPRSGNKIVVD